MVEKKKKENAKNEKFSNERIGKKKETREREREREIGKTTEI